VVIQLLNVGEGDGIVIKDGSWAGLVDGGRRTAPAPSRRSSQAWGSRTSTPCWPPTRTPTTSAISRPGEAVPPAGRYSDDVGTTKTYRGFMAALHAVHTRVVSVFRGHVLALGPLKASPQPRPRRQRHQRRQHRAAVRLDGHEVLLTGDDYGPSEDYVGSVVARGPPLYILKVAHHGSKYATSAAFLAQTRPRYAVISVGHNSYGHPRPRLSRG